MHCVAFLGSKTLPEDDPLFSVFKEAGRLIAELGLCVISHGTTGVAEAVSRGAKEVPGATIVGFTIDGELGNRHLNQLCSSLGQTPQIRAGSRLGRLLTADSFIFGPPTDRRTLGELTMALAWNHDPEIVNLPKHIAVLQPTTESEPGWRAQLLNISALLDLSNVRFVNSAKAAVDWITEVSVPMPAPATT